jgi:hypothetical protein
MNSGKPMLKPCPNCFVCTFDNEVEMNNHYWICYSLWKSESYYPNLKGSVIPFITIAETKKTILKASINIISSNKDFKKSIEVLKSIESNENRLKLSIQKINELKKAFLFKILT